jgi:hypothetical protein
VEIFRVLSANTYQHNQNSELANIDTTFYRSVLCLGWVETAMDDNLMLLPGFLLAPLTRKSPLAFG